jgi:hypothetical protein
VLTRGEFGYKPPFLSRLGLDSELGEGVTIADDSIQVIGYDPVNLAIDRWIAAPEIGLATQINLEWSWEGCVEGNHCN